MKYHQSPTLISMGVILTLGMMACSQGPAENSTETARPQPPEMKMTTEIPASIEIADEVQTRLGTLRFEGGFPTEETAQKIYDQLDFQRAVESVMMTTPAASDRPSKVTVGPRRAELRR